MFWPGFDVNLPFPSRLRNLHLTRLIGTGKCICQTKADLLQNGLSNIYERDR